MSFTDIRVIAALSKACAEASESWLNTKKPLFAFIDFCNANRHTVKKSNPTATWVESQMVLENVWKGMSESEKSVYYETEDNALILSCFWKEKNESELRRSSRLRNKRLGLNFWGLKINKK